MSETYFLSPRANNLAQQVRDGVTLFGEQCDVAPTIYQALLPERVHIYDTGHSEIDAVFQEVMLKGIRNEVMGRDAGFRIPLGQILAVQRSDRQARLAMREEAAARGGGSLCAIIDNSLRINGDFPHLVPFNKALGNLGLLVSTVAGLPFQSNNLNYQRDDLSPEIPPAAPLYSIYRQLTGGRKGRPIPWQQVADYYLGNQLINDEPENLIERAEHWRLLTQFEATVIILNRLDVMQGCGNRRQHEGVVAFACENLTGVFNDDLEGRSQLALSLAGLAGRLLEQADRPGAKRQLLATRAILTLVSRQLISHYTAFRPTFEEMDVPVPDALLELDEKYPTSQPVFTAQVAATTEPTPSVTKTKPEIDPPDPALVEKISNESASLNERAQKLLNDWTHSGTRHDKLGLRPVSDDIKFGVADYRGQASMNFIPEDVARQIVNLIQLVSSRVTKRGEEIVWNDLQSALTEQQAVNTALGDLRSRASRHSIPLPRVINPPILTQASRYILDDDLWRHIQTAIRNHWPLKDGKHVGQQVVETVEQLRTHHKNTQAEN